MEREQLGSCRGVGFQEEEYNVVVGPKPWPCTTACSCICENVGECACCLCQGLGYCVQECCSCLCISFPVVCCLSVTFSALLLGLLHQYGTKEPRTELEALTIHYFKLTLDNTSMVTDPWLANGNFTVLYQVRNPSWVVGFKHRHYMTNVSAFYNGTLLGQAEVPRFSLGYKSARDVRADVIFNKARMSQAVGLILQTEIQKQSDQVDLHITVDGVVKVKTFYWYYSRLYKMSCWVYASMLHTTHYAAGNSDSKFCRFKDENPV